MAKKFVTVQGHDIVILNCDLEDIDTVDLSEIAHQLLNSHEGVIKIDDVEYNWKVENDFDFTYKEINDNPTLLNKAMEDTNILINAIDLKILLQRANRSDLNRFHELNASHTVHELDNGMAYINKDGLSYRLFSSFLVAMQFLETHNINTIIEDFSTEEELDEYLEGVTHCPKCGSFGHIKYDGKIDSCGCILCEC